ncbi:Uncharacterised protein [Klebsiella pneumoniae]|nr:Uncharacterised protein [Klebsiella pneumoniae]
MFYYLLLSSFSFSRSTFFVQEQTVICTDFPVDISPYARNDSTTITISSIVQVKSQTFPFCYNNSREITSDYLSVFNQTRTDNVMTTDTVFIIDDITCNVLITQSGFQITFKSSVHQIFECSHINAIAFSFSCFNNELFIGHTHFSGNQLSDDAFWSFGISYRTEHQTFQLSARMFNDMVRNECTQIRHGQQSLTRNRVTTSKGFRHELNVGERAFTFRAFTVFINEAECINRTLSLFRNRNRSSQASQEINTQLIGNSAF